MKKPLALGALLVLCVGCDVVLGIEAGSAKPPDPPMFVPECVSDADCIEQLGLDQDCAAPHCMDGKCEPRNSPDGSLVRPERQTKNDCQRLVCDGNGGTKYISDNDADDANACTEEHCVDGVITVGDKLTGAAVACYDGPEATRGVGICREGSVGCNNGVETGSCVGQVVPQKEVCLNGTDDDCDGNPDENFDGCVCGDGNLTPEVGEQCDDGGTFDADVCSYDCKEQRVLHIDGESNHFCALLSGGRMKCWGRDSFGELGISDSDDFVGYLPNHMGANLDPIDFGGKKVVFISAEQASSCAVFEDGEARCWGANFSSSLGQPNLATHWLQSPAPLSDLALGGPVRMISGARDHKCALLMDGRVKCWGFNAVGSLGLADNDSSIHPVPTKDIDFGGKVVKQIATGGYHTCALLVDGDVKCWGYNDRGQLGRDTTAHYGLASGQTGANLSRIPFDKPAKWIAADLYASCAVFEDGTAMCWGDNRYGQLGQGDNKGNNINIGDQVGEMAALKPIDLGLPSGVVVDKMFASYAHICALLSNGTMKCWGNNQYDELLPPEQQTNNIGDEPNEMGFFLPFVDVGATQVVTDIAVNQTATCALLEAGNVKCWGMNWAGVLGINEYSGTTSIGDDSTEMGDALVPVRLFSDNW